MSTQETLSGWGGYPAVECRQITARSPEEAAILTRTEPRLIARGAGRSYGDAALNADCTLNMTRLDRILSFDESTGVLICESGVMLSDILDVFLPRGWFPPVTPGTKFVTVGGMVAADVHGKNHHKAGSFCDYVEFFELVTGEGRSVICSRRDYPDLFEATRGGMGLTGIILTVAFRLLRVESGYIRQRTLVAQDLTEIMEQCEANAHWTYSAAWIDCLARGEQTGRSVLYLGEHATADECMAQGHEPPYTPPKRKSLTVPPVFPSFAMNRLSIRAFNALYYGRAKAGESIIGYESFFYPLDALLSWNRMYGRKGFTQYQCVIPRTGDAAKGIRTLLDKIAASGMGSFLAVLKLLGPHKGGLMSFPMEGYTLALDFPVSRRSLKLLDELDAVVEHHGGRVYLAKDARMRSQTARKQYPRLSHFKGVRASWNATRKFISHLSERLEL